MKIKIIEYGRVVDSYKVGDMEEFAPVFEQLKKKYPGSVFKKVHEGFEKG